MSMPRCTLSPLSGCLEILFWGRRGRLCVSVPRVFQHFGMHPHTCLFVFPPAHPGFPDLCARLAATGQLINQIFKQCSSAQWVVPDYLWMLAVRGPATLHASSWTGIICPSPPHPWLSALIPTFLIRTLRRSLSPSLVFSCLQLTIRTLCVIVGFRIDYLTVSKAL